MISIYFNSSGKSINTNRMWLTPIKILTQEQYDQKKSNSLTLLIALFSILVISLIIAINNLRQIFYNKKN